jgi:hypothetical protein
MTTRRCESCRKEFTDDRLSAYCVACAAAFDEHFRRVSNVLIAYFARLCRERGDEAEARRIERGKR